MDERNLEEVSSRMLPSLERNPGKNDNWVENTGGLPSYINRIAKHIHAEGKPIGTSIAIAVGTCKRWCATSKKADTKAKACAAIAQWESKKLKSKAKTAAKHAMKESTVLTDEQVSSLGQALEKRLLIAEGMLPALKEPNTVGKASLVESARDLLEADLSDPISIGRIGGASAVAQEMKKASVAVQEEVDELKETLVNLGLREADDKSALAGYNASGAAHGRAPVKAAGKMPSGGSKGGGKGGDFEKKHPRGKEGTPTGGKFVKKGDSGAAVAGLQSELGVKTTGKFDGTTAQAVRDYQKENDLEVDGIVGSQTAASMQGRSAKPGELSRNDKKWMRKKAGNVSEATFQPLQKGSKSDLVKSVQEKLLAEGAFVGDDGANGSFTDDTERAVKAVQRRKNLKATGIVDWDTYQTLTEAAEAVESPTWELTEAGLGRLRSIAPGRGLGERGRIASEIKRLPDGTFAPKGMGSVLHPGDEVNLGGTRGKVEAGGKKIKLANGESLALAKSAQAPEVKAPRQPDPEDPFEMDPDYAAGIAPAKLAAGQGMASPEFDARAYANTLKPKDIDRLRDRLANWDSKQWPESERKNLEAVLAAVDKVQGGMASPSFDEKEQTLVDKAKSDPAYGDKVEAVLSGDYKPFDFADALYALQVAAKDSGDDASYQSVSKKLGDANDSKLQAATGIGPGGIADGPADGGKISGGMWSPVDDKAFGVPDSDWLDDASRSIISGETPISELRPEPLDAAAYNISKTLSDLRFENSSITGSKGRTPDQDERLLKYEAQLRDTLHQLAERRKELFKGKDIIKPETGVELNKNLRNGFAFLTPDLEQMNADKNPESKQDWNSDFDLDEPMYELGWDAEETYSEGIDWMRSQIESFYGDKPMPPAVERFHDFLSNSPDAKALSDDNDSSLGLNDDYQKVQDLYDRLNALHNDVEEEIGGPRQPNWTRSKVTPLENGGMWSPPNEHLAAAGSPIRSGAGRVRNVKAMNNDKLVNTAHQQESYNDNASIGYQDWEGIQALNDEIDRRMQLPAEDPKHLDRSTLTGGMNSPGAFERSFAPGDRFKSEWGKTGTVIGPDDGTFSPNEGIVGYSIQWDEPRWEGDDGISTALEKGMRPHDEATPDITPGVPANVKSRSVRHVVTTDEFGNRFVRPATQAEIDDPAVDVQDGFSGGMGSPSKKLMKAQAAAVANGKEVVFGRSSDGVGYMSVKPGENPEISLSDVSGPVANENLGPQGKANVAVWIANAIDKSQDVEPSDQPDVYDTFRSFLETGDPTALADQAGIPVTKLKGGMNSPTPENPVPLPSSYSDNVKELEMEDLPVGTLFATAGGWTYVLHKPAGTDGKWVIAKPVDADGNIILNDPHPGVGSKKSHGPTRRILFHRMPARAIGPMHPDYVDEATTDDDALPDVTTSAGHVSANVGLDAYAAGSPIRSEKGNIRNVKAMSNDKFLPLYDDMQAFATIDPGGWEKVNAEYGRRSGLPASDPKSLAPPAAPEPISPDAGTEKPSETPMGTAVKTAAATLPEPPAESSPARSGKGNHRNYKAMNDDKLYGLALDMEGQAGYSGKTWAEIDPDAVQKINVQLQARDLPLIDTPHRAATPPKTVPAPAPVAAAPSAPAATPGDESGIYNAIKNAIDIDPEQEVADYEQSLSKTPGIDTAPETDADWAAYDSASRVNLGMFTANGNNEVLKALDDLVSDGPVTWAAVTDTLDMVGGEASDTAVRDAAMDYLGKKGLISDIKSVASYPEKWPEPQGSANFDAGVGEDQGNPTMTAHIDVAEKLGGGWDGPAVEKVLDGLSDKGINIDVLDEDPAVIAAVIKATGAQPEKVSGGMASPGMDYGETRSTTESAVEELFSSGDYALPEEVESVSTFEGAGVLTNDAGLVIDTEGGNQYQLNIKTDDFDHDREAAFQEELSDALENGENVWDELHEKYEVRPYSQSGYMTNNKGVDFTSFDDNSKVSVTIVQSKHGGMWSPGYGNIDVPGGLQTLTNPDSLALLVDELNDLGLEMGEDIETGTLPASNRLAMLKRVVKGTDANEALDALLKYAQGAGDSTGEPKRFENYRPVRTPGWDPENMSRDELLAALGLENSDLSDSELADRLTAKRRDDE